MPNSTLRIGAEDGRRRGWGASCFARALAKTRIVCAIVSLKITSAISLASRSLQIVMPQPALVLLARAANDSLNALVGPMAPGSASAFNACRAASGSGTR